MCRNSRNDDIDDSVEDLSLRRMAVTFFAQIDAMSAYADERIRPVL